MNLPRLAWAAAALALDCAAGAWPAAAQGHGPVYGLSTPTLGRGGWSLDVAAMGRWLDGGRAGMVRPMLSYGVTEDVQVSLSVPLALTDPSGSAPMRGLMRMPATRDAELMVGWRFQRRSTGVGARWESTLWLAMDQPLEGAAEDGTRPRSLFGAVATGYASRIAYLWLGASYGRALPGRRGSGAREGDVAMASVVVGYRPDRFRGEYPEPDWRAFIEIVGERQGWRAEAGPQPDSAGSRRELAVALTLLGLYGSWGIAGGPAILAYQDGTGGAPAERVRMTVNLILWL